MAIQLVNPRLSKKQKEVMRKMQSGYFLYENRITPGARWSLSKIKGNYQWGNVNGNTIASLMHLLQGRREHIGCFVYELTELGKIVDLA